MNRGEQAVKWIANIYLTAITIRRNNESTFWIFVYRSFIFIDVDNT